MRHNTALQRDAIADPLDEYLGAIGRYHLLTPEQERAVGDRIRQGDLAAVDALVCANLRFVVSIAKRYQGHSVSLLDLIDEGNLGLIRAAQRFDASKGIRFITYAVWWIRQAILQALSQQSRLVRIPMSRVSVFRRIGRRAHTLLQELGREPTDEEIAAGLDITETEIAEARSMSQPQLSLDASVPNGENRLLTDYLPDTQASSENETYDNELSNSIAEGLSHLNKRDVTVLRLYFGLNDEDAMTLEEIGSRLGVTRERVRQLRDRGLRKLRRTMPPRVEAY